MRPLAPDDPGGARGTAAGGIYDSVTGHTVSGAFLDWYTRHEGDYYLGSPLSEVVTENGMPAQWFDRGCCRDARLKVQLALLGEQLAARLRREHHACHQLGCPLRRVAFRQGCQPFPVDVATAPGPKRIEVSIAEQRLRAYEGETLILETFISTGLPPNDTETGRLGIRYKVLVEDMRGATDAEGNVVWVVGDGGRNRPAASPTASPTCPT